MPLRTETPDLITAVNRPAPRAEHGSFDAHRPKGACGEGTCRHAGVSGQMASHQHDVRTVHSTGSVEERKRRLEQQGCTKDAVAN